jgi:hypothetical protein
MWWTSHQAEAEDMNLRVILTGVAAAALLTGCGGGSAAPPKSQPTSADNALIELAQCARKNGEPSFPDPTQDPTGAWGLPSSADGKKIPAACDAIRARLKGQKFAPKPASAENMTKLRAFADCVRKQGVSDWPDPSADGTFTLPSRLQQGGKALLLKPTGACLKLAPGGRYDVKDSDSGSS